MKLWSGRISGTMSEAMAVLNNSLDVDIRLLPADLKVNQAWAAELERIGILSKDERKSIDSALKQIKAEYCESRTTHHESRTLNDEDVHSLVERRLTELTGDAGAKIHTGRSRNDQVMTDLRLYLKEAVGELQGQIRALVKTLVEQAKQHQRTILPGYTHLQQAQPVSLAHYLLSAATVLRDDHARLADALKRIDFCPLGSGALAGSAYPIDRAAVAGALGFAGPTPNSLAAVSMRDECLEVASACAVTMTHLSRYAEDWIIWSGQEFRFVTLSDTVTTGSSMMPQKKNPDALELIRGKAARVIGQMQTLFTLMKGLPLTYARDLQEDKPALFDCLDQTSLCLTVFAETVRTATFHVDRMRDTLDANLYATELADYLVSKGVPFRRAHKVVGGIVNDCVGQGQSLAVLSPSDLGKYAEEFGNDVGTCLNPQAALERRNLIGGTGPESITTQLQEFDAWMKS